MLLCWETHNLPHSKDHRELTSWVLSAIYLENTGKINRSTIKQTKWNKCSLN